MPSDSANAIPPSATDTGNPCAMMSVTVWLRYLKDGPKSPCSTPPM